MHYFFPDLISILFFPNLQCGLQPLKENLTGGFTCNITVETIFSFTLAVNDYKGKRICP